MLSVDGQNAAAVNVDDDDADVQQARDVCVAKPARL